MKRKNVREAPFEHIGKHQYGFFVRMTPKVFEAGNTMQENSFETWKKGKANPRLCFTISVDKLALEGFFTFSSGIYPYCECVLVPEKSVHTVEEVNKIMKEYEYKNKTENEKISERLLILEEENKRQKEEILQLRSQKGESDDRNSYKRTKTNELKQKTKRTE